MYGSVNVILYALTTSSVLTSNEVTSVRYGQRNPLRTDHQFDINFKRSLQQFYLLILKYVSACQNLGSDKQNK